MANVAFGELPVFCTGYQSRRGSAFCTGYQSRRGSAFCTGYQSRRGSAFCTGYQSRRGSAAAPCSVSAEQSSAETAAALPGPADSGDITCPLAVSVQTGTSSVDVNRVFETATTSMVGVTTAMTTKAALVEQDTVTRWKTKDATRPTMITGRVMRVMARIRPMWISLLLALVVMGTTEGNGRYYNAEPAPYETQGVNVTVIEGKTAILPCSVSQTHVEEGRPVKVVWTDQMATILTFRNETIIDDDRLHVEHTFAREWNLKVERVKYGDQGIYTCQISTEPVLSYIVHLTVVVPPRLLTDASGGVVEVLEGSKAELVCNASGIPAPTIMWYRKALPNAADNRERIGEAGQVLVIHNVTRFCGGTYECVAENGVPPSVRREIQVKVKFIPEITLPTKRISQVMGKDTILECVIAAHPQGQVMWKFHNKQISSNEKYSVNLYSHTPDQLTLSLTIRQLQPEDFGKYTCIASNSLGEASKKMTLSELVIRTKPVHTTTLPPLPTPATLTPGYPQRLQPQGGEATVGGPQADRRVHPAGERGESEAEAGGQGNFRHGQAPPQPLDSAAGQWQRPHGSQQTENKAKSGRVSASPAGPRLSLALLILSLLTAFAQFAHYILMGHIPCRGVLLDAHLSWL